MLNDSIHYQDGVLYCDEVAVPDIISETESPVYIYSLRRAVANYRRIETAFSSVKPHIHYSAKANANLTVLSALIKAGAGVDAVSGGEIHRALKAGAKGVDIVFAGVGKTPPELRYALDQGVGWFNVENVAECGLLNSIATAVNRTARVALRLNPEVTANTHPYIATGHGGAKFGLTAEAIKDLLAHQADYPQLRFEGIHVHIGSQLHDAQATQKAIQIVLDLMQPYPNIRTLNIGGGLPVAYSPDEHVPSYEEFASSLIPLLQGYTVLLEPGRSIIADAGLLAISVYYVKKQAGQTFLITDGSMAELIRPALYQAHHEIIPVNAPDGNTSHPNATNVVGPVCETADMLGQDVPLPDMNPGDQLAVLTVGAYGMVMASNYNQRLRPPEVVVEEDGKTWRVARRRETWDDLIRYEI
jgi:diaminopimelate decarboxylase